MAVARVKCFFGSHVIRTRGFVLARTTRATSSHPPYIRTHVISYIMYIHSRVPLFYSRFSLPAHTRITVSPRPAPHTTTAVAVSAVTSMTSLVRTHAHTIHLYTHHNINTHAHTRARVYSWYTLLLLLLLLWCINIVSFPSHVKRLRLYGDGVGPGHVIYSRSLPACFRVNFNHAGPPDFNEPEFNEPPTSSTQCRCVYERAPETIETFRRRGLRVRAHTVLWRRVLGNVRLGYRDTPVSAIFLSVVRFIAALLYV